MGVGIPLVSLFEVFYYVVIYFLNVQHEGRLSGSDGWASAFGSGCGLRVLESSPESGSVLSRESVSPYPSAAPPAFVR